MTTVSYALGTPRAAVSRGGDCAAWDLARDRPAEFGHHFLATDDCQISNGMLRLTVGASGVAPTLTMEAVRGRTTVDDVVTDLLTDLLGGSISTRAWFNMGTVVIDTAENIVYDDFYVDLYTDLYGGAVTHGVLTDVQIVRRDDEVVILRLVAPLLHDAFVTLRRGERMVRIQHGDTRGTLVVTDRRVRLTDSPAPTGTAFAGRIEEQTPAVQGAFRFVAALDPVTGSAGAFSVTAEPSSVALFGAGVATSDFLDKPYNLHSQLGDSSRAKVSLT